MIDFKPVMEFTRNVMKTSQRYLKLNVDKNV